MCAIHFSYISNGVSFFLFDPSWRNEAKYRNFPEELKNLVFLSPNKQATNLQWAIYEFLIPSKAKSMHVACDTQLNRKHKIQNPITMRVWVWKRALNCRRQLDLLSPHVRTTGCVLYANMSWRDLTFSIFNTWERKWKVAWHFANIFYYSISSHSSPWLTGWRADGMTFIERLDRAPLKQHNLNANIGKRETSQ